MTGSPPQLYPIERLETLFSTVDIYTEFVVKVLKDKPSLPDRAATFYPFDQQSAFLNEQACLHALAGRQVPRLLTSDESGHIVKMQNVGHSLHAWREVTTGGKLDSRALLRLLADAAASVAGVHEAGIVHGDLRDENFCLRVEGEEPWQKPLRPEALWSDAARVSLIDFTFALMKGHAIKPPPYAWDDSSNKWMSRRAKSLVRTSWEQLAGAHGMTQVEFANMPAERQLTLYIGTASSTSYPYLSLDWTADLFSFGKLVEDFAHQVPRDDPRLEFLHELASECRRYDESVPDDARYTSMRAVEEALRDAMESTDDAVLPRRIFIAGTEPPNAEIISMLAGLPPARPSTDAQSAAATSAPASERFQPPPAGSTHTEPPQGMNVGGGAAPPVGSRPPPEPSAPEDPIRKRFRPTPNFEDYDGEEPPVMKSRVLGLLYGLAGAETREIYRLPDAASKAKYLSVGLMMLMVMVWAMVSSYHFIREASADQGPLAHARALGLAFFWGMFVLVIEKAIISTVPNVFPEASDSLSVKLAFYGRYFGAVGVRAILGIGIAGMLALMSLTIIFSVEIERELRFRTIAQLDAEKLALQKEQPIVDAEDARVVASTLRAQAAQAQSRAASAASAARMRRQQFCAGDRPGRLAFLRDARDLTPSQIAERNELQRIRSRCSVAIDNARSADNAARVADEQLTTRATREEDAIAKRQQAVEQVEKGERARVLKEVREMDSGKSFARSLVGLSFLVNKKVPSPSPAAPGSIAAPDAPYEQVQAATIKWLILPLAMLFLGVELLVLITRLMGRPLVDLAVSYRDRSIVRHLQDWYRKQHE